MVTIVTRPDWTGIMTAIGTVALAIVAVFAPIYTEWRANKRLKTEHERSDKVLADERALSETRLHAERQIARNREQLSEAYAVQVVLVRYAEGSENQDSNYLEAMIVNRGNYTISRIEARFSPDGKNLISHRVQIRMAGISNLPPEMHAQVLTARPAEAASANDLLTPWDTGMRVRTDAIGVNHLTDPQTIVRWTDQWGTRWEHRRGDVRQVDEGAEWSLR